MLMLAYRIHTYFYTLCCYITKRQEEKMRTYIAHWLSQSLSCIFMNDTEAKKKKCSFVVSLTYYINVIL